MDHTDKLDIYPDQDGTFLVYFKNKQKLLYDGLLDTFNHYGKISAITDKGSRNIYIRYVDKESALKCFRDLNGSSRFQVDLPHKYYVEDNIEDEYLKSIEGEEASISFDKKTDLDNDANDAVTNFPYHYMRRKRRIVKSCAFKRYIISLAACNQYIRVRDDRKSLLEELKFQMKGVRSSFKTGFADEPENNSDRNELPQLVLAKDLHYFQNVKTVNAVDVLVCNLPPWYQEVDLFRLIFHLVPDDYLGLDWHRTYAAGNRECSFPFAIAYLKDITAANRLMCGVDGIFIDRRQINVRLMDDVEGMLVEVITNPH